MSNFIQYEDSTLVNLDRVAYINPCDKTNCITFCFDSIAEDDVLHVCWIIESDEDFKDILSAIKHRQLKWRSDV